MERRLEEAEKAAREFEAGGASLDGALDKTKTELSHALQKVAVNHCRCY